MTAVLPVSCLPFPSVNLLLFSISSVGNKPVKHRCHLCLLLSECPLVWFNFILSCAMGSLNMSSVMSIMRASPVYQQITNLSLPNASGVMVDALELGIEGLQAYCNLPLVAEFANLTLHSYAMSSPVHENAISAPMWVRILLSIIFTMVGIIGMVGNSLTVLVIYKTQSLHSHTNVFLANLAISDLLLILVGVPFDLFQIWSQHQPPPIAGYCAFMSTSISLFTFASILTIVSLTAERFVAICYPFSHRAVFDKRSVIQLVYVIWLIAFFPSLYIGLQFKRVVPDFCGYKRELSSSEGSCDYATSPNMPFRYPFEMIMILTFVLPLIFIVYCYVRILATLNVMAAQTTVHVPIGSTNSDSSQINTPSSILYVHTRNYAPPKSQQAQRMVIKMLVTVTAVFFICYLPYHVERLIVQYTKKECDKSVLCLLLYPITGLLQYISATLNPIFYNLMSTRFRIGFSQLIKNAIPQKDKYSSIARM